MARPDQIGTSDAPIPRVNIGWIHPFLEVLDELGAPYEPILEQANLPVLAIDDSSAIVPTASVYEFVALASQATELPDLGLRAGERFDVILLLPRPEWAWTQPGIFRSIESFIRVALDSSSNVDMWIEARDDPEPTTEFFYLGTFELGHPAFIMVEQFMVALMVRMARLGAGPQWNPSRINLRAAAVPGESIRQLAGDAQVCCGHSVTSIVFPSQQFRGPVEQFPSKSSAIWKRHRRWLEDASRAQDLAGALRVVLPAYLPDGSPDIRQAARLAGTSVRTLQRRLQEQGLTYSQLLEDLRHDLAIFLLRDPRQSAATISSELGYRDPAIFTRAFRRWTGKTPSQYRRELAPLL